jgi:formylglycine-generating enzyme required for sulfatase activity
MKQHNIFCRLGPVFLALSITLSGCEYPTETIYIKVPVETPIEIPDKPPIETPEEEAPGEQLPGITDFTFTPVNPIRTVYAVKGKPVGRISNPVGGTAPFTYALASGDGNNDMDNSRFTVSGDLLKIQADNLADGVYFICLKVTDNKGIFYSKAVTVTVAKDPAALDQETRTVGGISFKMRYVPSGAFMKPDPMNNMNPDPMNEGDILVHVPTGFWIAETETTQDLYQFVMNENPSKFKDNPAPGEVQGNRPVDSVLWYEAVLFCNRLSVITGREPVYHIWGVPDWEIYLKWAIDTKSTSAESNIFIDEKANGYRLPTTNEWLWAAIGADMENPGQVNALGTRKCYSGGSVGIYAGIENFAWVNNNSSLTTHEVGKLSCNELGLFDMTGNVTEWAWKTSYTESSFGTRGDSTISEHIVNRHYFERLASFGIRFVSNQ